MKIKITGKELKITDAINDYAEKKMERIETVSYTHLTLPTT